MPANEPGPEFPSTWARVTPHKPAVIVDHPEGERTLTYAQLDDRSTRCARLLREAGLRPGGHVAVLMENRTEVFEVAWAAQRSGLYLTMINTHLSADEARYVVADCGAEALVVSDRYPELAGALLEGGPAVRARLVVGGGSPGYEEYGAALEAVAPGPLEDECEGDVMLYSSGTTGRPKGIKRPMSLGPPGSDFRLRDLITSLGFRRDTVYLSPAPLHHAAPIGFTTAVHRLGGTAIVMPRFDAERCLQLIERHRVTEAQFVPTMFFRLLRLPEEVRRRHDLSSLRGVVHAAAPCPIPIKREMLDWWGPIIWEYYSGTEGNGRTCVGPQEWLERPGTVGRPINGRVHILGEDGQELPTGETGTVYFASGRRFEYHNDPVKTAGSHNEHGWSTLGDVGHIDEDGYLYLTDRASHMIISGGVNIYPQETENVLQLHPAVADAAVIGVPDPEMGERVLAVVELTDPAAAGDALARELIEFCRDRLAHYKCPRAVDFTDALPRQDNGKLYKRLLKQAYSS
ncbi:MAG TPA: acyl-CoA synthetase [Pseudonocardia sp.]|nr:acyl-CoA synthetase [Pseudonocardia sp.]